MFWNLLKMVKRKRHTKTVAGALKMHAYSFRKKVLFACLNNNSGYLFKVVIKPLETTTVNFVCRMVFSVQSIFYNYQIQNP